MDRADAGTGRLRVAIAGCHRMLARPLASHNFAADFAAVPETEVVAVFDRGADTRAAFVECWREVWGPIAAYDDFGRMVDEVRPDLVCISTRQTMHAAQVEQAVAAGVKGILCDKPLVTSLLEADALLARCRQARVPLAYGLMRRWDAAYRRLAGVVAEGAVGAVTGVMAYGVPNLNNLGPHWYDVLLEFLGDPEPVWASGLIDDLSALPPDSPRRLDPPGRGQVGLASPDGEAVAPGAVAYVTPAGGPRPAFEVLGTKGRLLVLDDARAAYLWDGESGSGAPPRVLDLPPREGFAMGIEAVHDLVRAVQTGGQTACDVEQARRATEIGFALHLSSAASGARVDLPAADRSLRIESTPWGNE